MLFNILSCVWFFNTWELGNDSTQCYFVLICRRKCLDCSLAWCLLVLHELGIQREGGGDSFAHSKVMNAPIGSLGKYVTNSSNALCS